MKCLVGSVSSDEKVLAADHVTQALQPYWSVNQLSQIKIARGIANPYLLRPCSYGSDKNWELCWIFSFLQGVLLISVGSLLSRPTPSKFSQFKSGKKSNQCSSSDHFWLSFKIKCVPSLLWLEFTVQTPSSAAWWSKNIFEHHNVHNCTAAAAECPTPS